VSPPRSFSSFRYADFRFLATGQLLATIADQIQTVAIAWQIYELTDSAVALGLVGLAKALPLMGLSVLGGATADAFNRRGILVLAQLSSMGLVGLLGLATASTLVAPALIYLVAVGSGAIAAFREPARQAVVPATVPAPLIGGAVTLGTVVRQIATIAGPGIGGLAIGLSGLAATYVLSACLFGSAAVVSLGIRSWGTAERRTSSRTDFVLSGLRFARGQPIVMAVLAFDFLVSVLGTARALLPIFARDILVVGPEGLGVLNAAISAGAAVGGAAIAMGNISRPLPVMVIATALRGVFLFFFAISPAFVVSVLMLAGTGLATVVGEVCRMTIVLSVTPDPVRGRVLALSLMFTGGGPPAGQLTSGVLATAVGPVVAAVVGAAGIIFCVVGFSRLGSVRTAWTGPEPVR
jgi:MFS family permease